KVRLTNGCGCRRPLPIGERDGVRRVGKRSISRIVPPSPGRYAADLSPTGRGGICWTALHHHDLRAISRPVLMGSRLVPSRRGVLPWFGMAAGGIIAALIALALGYPCFRLRGHYFAIATIVIAEIGYLLFLNWDFAGAATGIDIPIRRDSWLTFQFTRSKLPY